MTENAMPENPYYLFDADYRNEGLFLANIGYNDFATMDPLKVVRVQDGYTLHIVTGGRGHLFLGDEQYDLSAGDVFFIPPHVPMMYYPEESDPWKYYWFFVQGELPRQMGETMGFSLEKPVKHLDSLEKRVLSLSELFDGGYSADQRYYRSLSMLMNLVAILSSPKRETSGATGADLVERAKELIQLNYRNSDFTVDVLAKMTFANHSYLTKIFHRETGMTVIAYVIKLRLEYAARILEAKPCPVRELCNSVGFRDEIHFMKAFKQYFGVTVKEYRNGLRADS